jgi:transcriptional regulator with PAS, ATPase and Fis domain
LLNNYFWPGNIRELKNVIETAAALNKTGILSEDSFVNLLSKPRIEEETKNLPIHLQRSSESLDREMILGALIEIKKDLNELKNFAYRSNIPQKSEEANYDLDEIIPITKLEKDAIKKALSFTKESKRKAANLLGISERTLYRKIKEYGI